MSATAIQSVVVLVILAIVTYIMYNARKHARREAAKEDKMTLDSLLEKVKSQLVDLCKDDNIMGKDGEEWERAYSRLKRIQKAMRDCVYGIMKEKITVKDYIKVIIQEMLPDDEAVDNVLDLNSPFLHPMIKWEIMAYFLSKTKGNGVIKYLFDKYHTDDVKYIIEDGTVPHYAWTAKECETMYQNEILGTYEITYLDKLEIISTLLYEKYKGFGCVDTLRDMQIDGLNFGTSGSVLSNVLNMDRKVSKASASVWIYFRGKYIHAEFFDFYSENEVRRVVQLLCRYGNPGPLTEKRGYIVNNMYDQSRVLAVRPNAAEYWAVFIRKFDLGDMTLEKLIDPIKMDEKKRPILGPDGQPEHKYQRADIPFKLIHFLMKGQVTCGFTGRQGSGKTTMMKYAIGATDGRFTLRILEMTFEMYLREIYPDRNILSLQETPYVTAAELQDALKKSDAAISIVGEVATDIIAARMIQMGQVASIFTIFSHHANTTKDLVIALTNSIVASSHGAATPATTMPQVIDVVKIDVHLDYDVNGNRYIERITEIVRTDEEIPYVDIDPSNVDYCAAVNNKIFYTKTTDSHLFETHDIMRFNKDEWKYETCEFLSPVLTEHMLDRLDEGAKEEFIAFVEENWQG